MRFRTIWILHRIQLSIVDTIPYRPCNKVCAVAYSRWYVCAYGFDASHALELSRVLSSLGELQPDADTCSDSSACVGYIGRLSSDTRRWSGKSNAASIITIVDRIASIFFFPRAKSKHRKHKLVELGLKTFFSSYELLLISSYSSYRD